MPLFASWRHRLYVAHARTLQIRAVIEFPACFPAEAMAKVKSCLFYGGKSCFSVSFLMKRRTLHVTTAHFRLTFNASAVES